MPVHKGTPGPKFPPTVTTLAATNFNQNRCTFGATVNPRNTNTSVMFHWGTSPTLASFNVSSYGNMTGNTDQNIYLNITGLTPGTTYYYRVFAMSNVDNATGNIVSFTTWSLKTYMNTTAGSYSLAIPSITPFGGSAIAPTIYEMMMFGGGGSAAYSGGGGGGYRLFSSHTSSVAANTQNITFTIGAGGTNPSTVTPAPAGGASTLTIGSTTWTAGGGGGGRWLTDGAGAAGSGDNPSYAGGNGYYGYTYISGYNQYCCSADKNGTCLAYCDNLNSPIYTTDYSRFAGGGGGGTGGAGTNATYPDGGGNGGAGSGAYGLRGGNGGRGGGTASFGSDGSLPAGSGPTCGKGGSGWWGSGTAGGVTFKYYGP